MRFMRSGDRKACGQKTDGGPRLGAGGTHFTTAGPGSDGTGGGSGSPLLTNTPGVLECGVPAMLQEGLWEMFVASERKAWSSRSHLAHHTKCGSS